MMHTILAGLPSLQKLRGNKEADLVIKKSYTKIIFVTSENATYDKFSSINAYIWVKWNGVWISSESLLHNVRDNVWKVPAKSPNLKIQKIPHQCTYPVT